MKEAEKRQVNDLVALYGVDGVLAYLAEPFMSDTENALHRALKLAADNSLSLIRNEAEMEIRRTVK